MRNESEKGSALNNMEISDADFKRLVQFVQSKYGIDLHQKRQLIVSRLSSTIRGRGFTQFKDYVDYMLTRSNSEDINHLLSRLTTNYTYFMREMGAFDFFRTRILPDITRKHQRDKSLAIWSAGCSSGEEPYNISMYLMDFLGAQAGAWDTRLLATDISVEALSKAKSGIYELPDTLPANWKRNYFVPADGGKFTVAPRIKNNVIFQQFNLMEPIRFRRKFDVIFCRNVMIYFDQKTKRELSERFYEATAPGGYLIISMSENLDPGTKYRRVGASIFQK